MSVQKICRRPGWQEKKSPSLQDEEEEEEKEEEEEEEGEEERNSVSLTVVANWTTLRTIFTVKFVVYE